MQDQAPDDLGCHPLTMEPALPATNEQAQTINKKPANKDTTKKSAPKELPTKEAVPKVAAPKKTVPKKTAPENVGPANEPTRQEQPVVGSSETGTITVH